MSLLLIHDKEKFLLQLRDAKASILYPNHWGGFAGTIEQNENPREAAYRELFEELEIIPNKLDFFQTFSVPSDYTSIHVFSCKLENELHTKIKLNEGQEMGWFTANDIFSGFLYSIKNLQYLPVTAPLLPILKSFIL